MQIVLAVSWSILSPETGLLHQGPSADLERVLVREIQVDQEIADLACGSTYSHIGCGADAVTGRRSLIVSVVFIGVITSALVFSMVFWQVPNFQQGAGDIGLLDLGKDGISQGPQPSALRAPRSARTVPMPGLSPGHVKPATTGSIALRFCIDE